jgi:hypothetical protein
MRDEIDREWRTQGRDEKYNYIVFGSPNRLPERS